jgi:hypothetical protein
MRVGKLGTREFLRRYREGKETSLGKNLKEKYSKNVYCKGKVLIFPHSWCYQKISDDISVSVIWSRTGKATGCLRFTRKKEKKDYDEQSKVGYTCAQMRTQMKWKHCSADDMMPEV